MFNVRSACAKHLSLAILNPRFALRALPFALCASRSTLRASVAFIKNIALEWLAK
jgi:hypothetical protein